MSDGDENATAPGADGSGGPDGPDPASMSYEDALAELESIIERIEQGDVPLEAMLEARRRGGRLLHRCRSILDAAEQELESLALDDLPEAAGGEASA